MSYPNENDEPDMIILVNSCDARELRVIRGIGSELASHIIKLGEAGVDITRPILGSNSEGGSSSRYGIHDRFQTPPSQGKSENG